VFQRRSALDRQRQVTSRKSQPISSLGEGAGHLPQLDTLRAFAITAVLIRHFWPEIQPAIDLGNRGVRFFFVLSGFLITGILLRSRAQAEADGSTPGYSIRHFYARRVLRIFPVYYLVLALTWLLGFPEIRNIIGWHLLYATNIHSAIHAQYEQSASHLWSLSVEEQFYLVWPWLMFFVPRRWLPRALAAIVLMGPCFRLWGYLVGLNWVAMNVLPLASLDSLGLGAWLAWLYVAPTRPWARVRSQLGTAALLAIPIVAIGWINSATGRPHLGGWVRLILEDTAWACISLWIIDRAAQRVGGRMGRFLEWPPLMYLGRISYGVYLIHLFVPTAMYQLTSRVGLPYPATRPVQFLAWSAITIGLAALSWHFVERPINGLKRYFPYASRSETQTPARA
jgi:peptidoglycan/LPS O-acetylase OafA/YrhL